MDGLLELAQPFEFLSYLGTVLDYKWRVAVPCLTSLQCFLFFPYKIHLCCFATIQFGGDMKDKAQYPLPYRHHYGSF